MLFHLGPRPSPQCMKEKALAKALNKIGFFHMGFAVWRGRLSEQISFTSVVMEPGVFWKASVCSLFSPRVLVVLCRNSLVFPFRCVCFDLRIYGVTLVFGKIENVTGLGGPIKWYSPSRGAEYEMQVRAQTFGQNALCNTSGWNKNCEWKVNNLQVRGGSTIAGQTWSKNYFIFGHFLFHILL